LNPLQDVQTKQGIPSKISDHFNHLAGVALDGYSYKLFNDNPNSDFAFIYYFLC